MPLGALFPGAEALQGPVHAGGAHAQTHGREAAQVHGEAPVPPHVRAKSRSTFASKVPSFVSGCLKISLRTAFIEERIDMY